MAFNTLDDVLAAIEALGAPWEYTPAGRIRMLRPHGEWVCPICELDPLKRFGISATVAGERLGIPNHLVIAIMVAADYPVSPDRDALERACKLSPYTGARR